MKLFFLLLLFSYTFATNFTGKVVFLTGGSSGIGFATSLGFARAGATVIFIARDEHPDWYNGADAERKIKTDPQVIAANGTAKFIKADIRNLDEIKNVINFIHNNYGTIDIAVNNAGIGGMLGKMHEIPDNYTFGEHDPIYNNLYGTFNCMQQEVKYWYNHSRNGTMINLSSYNGIRACPTASMYSASKHGIIGLTESIALEYASGTPTIRANFTQNSTLWEQFKPLCEQDLPNGRLGDPSEMAAIIMFLASDEASYISGTTISGDFGLSAR
ncbi:dehydrogenases short chain [Anaeramoeba ignava]|uniref:Dehydrogenases short chain n=1 Tax=Anaeramoeba ignava TaxID=1746090 RepID=A0A9Q0LPZ9_ANAIG|nr:dehydrogenases short chain [Anaeramoeba ignava]